MKKLNAKALRAYPTKLFSLIPLHRYTDKSKKKSGRILKDGKRPLHNNWTQRSYDSAFVLAKCIEENRNMGVRLGPDQLVIDVDPRNGGEEGFTALCMDLGFDPDEYPNVLTGSGGGHFYMAKPADVLVLDTLEGYPGVEFKSAGRQVVSAGSIHPDTEDHYTWRKALAGPLPPAPKALIRLIKRPEREAISGGGQYTNAQIANALDHLDVTDFRQEDKWRRLMMACHHASAGDARAEFIDWSTSDPEYADDAERIGRRWDSCHTERNDGITYRTLNKFLGDADAASAQVIDRAEVAADFDEPLPEDPVDTSWLEGGDDTSEGAADSDGVREENEGGLTDEAISRLFELNAKYCTVVEGGKLRIVYKLEDPVMQRDTWARMNYQDFEKDKSNEKLERDITDLPKNAPRFIPLGKAWMEWPYRRKVESILFDPSGKEHPNRLNIWTGFGTKPNPKGEWSYLRELIHEVLCDGNATIDSYVMNWLRYLMQNPATPAEVALVFKGGKGTGKGTLGNTLVQLVGRHAMAIGSPEHLTGRFNAHLQDIIFLFADEAIRPYDKAAENALKRLVTEKRNTFEGKGLPTITSLNYVHLLMASNDSWVVPASVDERRFLVSDVNTKWLNDTKKFEKLNAQLRKGGYERMMFDLLREDIEDGWHPRQVPRTKALVDQMIRSFGPLEQYVFAMIDNGIPAVPPARGDWRTGPVAVYTDELRADFAAWCKDQGIRPGSMGRGHMRFFLKSLKGLVPNLTDMREPVPEDRGDIAAQDGTASAIQFPSLADCRTHFEEKKFKFPIAWTGEEVFDFG